ncbi:MAG: nuclear transport factor 2 family protein [Pseudomonadota bacterium]
MITSETWVAVATLMADYWWRVDGGSERPVDELYAENCLMHIGTARREGREQIRQFFEERRQGEIAARRTTRHLVSNLLIVPVEAGRIRVHSTVQVMAGNGDLPLASAPAATLADFEDVMVEVSPGVWRIENRRARVVFSGAGASSFAR